MDGELKEHRFDIDTGDNLPVTEDGIDYISDVR
jgi:hypothetical protein